MSEITKEMYESLDSLLQKVNLNDVSSESSGNFNLPDGIYKCEVKHGELKVTTTNRLMAMFRFKTTQNGLNMLDTGDYEEVPNTKGQTIFKNYFLDDEKSIKIFVSDMLKFEGDVEGEPYLPKESFTTSATLEDSVELLGESELSIWIQITSYKKKDDSIGTNISLLSWKRIDEWGLQ